MNDERRRRRRKEKREIHLSLPSLLFSPSITLKMMLMGKKEHRRGGLLNFEL
jgi:hypothetical protein